MSEKPGVMIYFEVWEMIKRMTDDMAGALFKAIMEYGATKRIPELPDPLFIIWPMVQARLDTDDERYYRVSQKRKYAAYTRWAKEHKEDPLPFDKWLYEIERFDREDADDDLPFTFPDAYA